LVLIIYDIISNSVDKHKKVMQKLKKYRLKPVLSTYLARGGRISVLVVSVVILAIGSIPHTANAVSCSSVASCKQQINGITNQSSTDKQAVGSLQSQDQSYQGTINDLSAQISSIETNISNNEAQRTSLEQQIAADQQQIVAEKSTLSDDITTMYVNGQMSTIEELATSKNLSDYADRQEYQTVVQNQLSGVVQQITSLEISSQAKKNQVDQLVSTEQAQNSQLSSSEAQQQALLGYNQSQQTAYNQQISANSSSLSQLDANLTALNNAGSSSIITGGTCGGGYPSSTPSSTARGTNWGCNQPQDNTTDNWDMLNRECVSYTAYMVSTKYGISTSGWGDAYQWITAAESHGYTVDQTPSPGAIASRDRDDNEPGDVGHAMYVVSVNGSDSITVDEYNEHYDGTFDERTFSPSSYASRGGLYFIHFQ
jgi:surface antigen/peptidoglycan hydrolase CwlO-like protein